MSLTLLDWRRRVARLYAEIRRDADVARAHQVWQRTRDDLLRHHPDSPVPLEQRDRFRGARVAAYDLAWRFEVKVDSDVGPARVEFTTGTDGVVPFDRIGRVRISGVGELDVWWLASYGGGVFVPVKDTTAGSETYGGGRYLLDTAKGADLGGSDGRLVLDFNFLYNPSCAYDPAWACPLAPAGNVVSVPLAVGELVPEL
jgi:uncharacterized protein (DUF1684 family)